MKKLLALSILTACTTTAPERVARVGEKVECVNIKNGPVTEMCLYPPGVICYGSDNGVSCIQILQLGRGPT